MIRILLSGWLALLSLHSLAHTELAGHMIMVRGDVSAINAQGEIRPLQRRSPIYSSDTVRTGMDSMAQLRFTDQALLALNANSELSIVDYQPPGENGEGTVLLRLIEGGFRTLTGSIGRGNKEAYRVETPVASIGIRGTLYSVNMQALRLSAGVWQGGIRIDSEQGTFDLGMDARYDFATLDHDGFRGLLTPPNELQPLLPARVPLPAVDDDEPLHKHHHNAPMPADLNEDSLSTDHRSLLNNDLSDINPFDQQSGSTNTSQFSERGQLLEQNGKIALPLELYNQLSETERVSLRANQQVGYLLENGQLIDVKAFTPDSELIIGNSESPYAFVADNPTRVYRSDTLRANIDIPEPVYSYSEAPIIEWGWWSYDSELIGIIGTDLLLDEDNLPAEHADQLWMVVTPTELSSLPTSGQVEFYSGNSIGLDNLGGSLSYADGHFTVDFNTGKVDNGQTNLYYDTSQWTDITFDGQLTRANGVASLNMNITAGNYSSSTQQDPPRIDMDIHNSHFSGVLTKDIEEQLLFASGLTLRANEAEQEHWAQAFIIWQGYQEHGSDGQ